MGSANKNQPVVKTTDSFFGREYLVSKVYARIGAERPQSVSLVGDPKIGKSALLDHLCRRETREALLHDPGRYIFVSMAVKELPRIDFSHFSSRLCTLICRSVDHDPDEIPDEWDYDRLKIFVEDQTRQNRNMILLFDDFHLITQNESFPLEFFSFLRSLANNYNLAYITTSHADLQKLCVSKEIEESPFFNIFTNITIKPFSDGEVSRYFSNALPGIGAENLARLRNLCGHFPYTVLLAGKLWSQWQAGEEGDVRTDFDGFSEEFYRVCRPYFDELWQVFRPEETRIFHSILKRSKIPRSLQYIFENLIRRQYIVSDNGRHRMFSPLFERFIAEKLRIPVTAGGNRTRMLLRKLQRVIGRMSGRNSENSSKHGSG